MLSKISLARGKAYLRCGASVLGIGALMSVMSPSAFAQSGDSQPRTRGATAVAPGGVDEIVVTARKREESSLEAPIAVQGFTGEQLRTRGITRMEEFARTIPSLILAEGS